MVKVHNFKVNPREYYTRGKNNIFPDQYKCPQKECRYKGQLKKHGFYLRNAISFEGTYRIYVKRYICPVCGHTLSLLPNFLSPRFQYTIFVISACLTALGLFQLTFEETSRSINITGFGYQHVSFYKRRLMKNENLCLPVLFTLNIKVRNQPFLTAWSRAVMKCTIKVFALEFQKSWHHSFLSPINGF